MLKLLVAIGLFVAGFAGTAHAQFCPGASPYVFDDVLASDPLCPDITWMSLNNITSGCRILGGVDLDYCPNDGVTRKQMAKFMFQLGKIRVQEVDTGPGLTGGPITLTGTIGLTVTQLLPTTACASSQVPQWNGSKWICAAAAGSGTVTSVAGGTGIVASPSPITGSGTLNLALSYQLPQGCGNGQVAKSNGAGGWTCAADADSGGTVTSITAGAGLIGGTITTSGTIAVDPTSSTLSGNYFKQGGNTFGATAVLGTTDNNALDVRVNGIRAMRFEPNATSPNVIGGHPNNGAGAFYAQTVAGGGAAGANCFDPPTGTSTRPCGNQASNNYATVGGGVANVASGLQATVAGGRENTASGSQATVAGGWKNTASGTSATVSGGEANRASDEASVGGGSSNDASGPWATVGGGSVNHASGVGATVSGGFQNAASGLQATVAGGRGNIAGGDHSFAAGFNAKTQTAGGTIHHGAFIFADNIDASFFTAQDNEFAIRATGGVRFVTAIDGAGSPTRTVAINANGELDFGSATRQMLNLWGTAYAIGVQSLTQYFRSDFNFAWYQQGSHSDATLDPGTGGTLLMSLTPSSSTVTPTGFARAQLFTSVSDRNAKTAFEPIEVKRVLESVVRLPITAWSFKNETDARHIGPVAQDFHAAFGVGGDDKTISTVDEGGVALAAIQGLYAELKDRDVTIMKQQQEIAEQRREIAAERHEIVELRERVAHVESLRGELTALRNAIAAVTRNETVAAEVDATVP